MSSTHPISPITPAKRRKWPLIVGGAALVVLVGCVGLSIAGGGHGDDSLADAEAANASAKPAATKKQDQTKKPDEKKHPGLNDPVRDGKFEFTVTHATCGATKVGSDLIGQKAQGQYCLIDLRVKNIGKEAQPFTDSAQKAYGAGKVEYSVDSAAAIYVNGDNQVLFQEINPGNVVIGRLVFDVPKGTKLTSLELHDSIFSGGVQVALK
jgi:hypothetical protein